MFYNRKDAALSLAQALEKYRNKNAIIIGLLRGGVEIAYYVAQELDAELSFVIVRKLGYPGNPEYGIGAMAEDGTVYNNPSSTLMLSQEMIDFIEDQQLEEIERRKKLYREVQAFPDIRGKTVIIVDDGIATGATILVAIEMCKKRGPAKIVVAAPVSTKRTEGMLRQEVDDVVILETPEQFFSVSQVYELFPELTDAEALAFLKKWERKTTGESNKSKKN